MNRKGSTRRSKSEDHFNDILCGLLKLIRVEQIPVISCDLLSLSTIPLPYSEELNNLSIIDRLNTLEAQNE